MKRSTVLVTLFFIAIAIVLGAMIAIAIRSPATAKYIFSEHIRHYIIGIVLSLVLIGIFWGRMDWKQVVIYAVVPSIIAAGWPDIVYFVSYVIQHQTVAGVLVNKNAVYYAMHNVVMSLTAPPVIVGALYVYDRSWGKNPCWYWPIVIVIATLIASMLHVVMDQHFGF